MTTSVHVCGGLAPPTVAIAPPWAPPVVVVRADWPAPHMWPAPRIWAPPALVRSPWPAPVLALDAYAPPVDIRDAPTYRLPGGCSAEADRWPTRSPASPPRPSASPSSSSAENARDREAQGGRDQRWRSDGNRGQDVGANVHLDTFTPDDPPPQDVRQCAEGQDDRSGVDPEQPRPSPTWRSRRPPGRSALPASCSRHSPRGRYADRASQASGASTVARRWVADAERAARWRDRPGLRRPP